MSTDSDDGHPIEPGLFALVRREASQIAAGELKGDMYLKGTPIVLFCQSFYEQFFAHVVGKPLTAINQEAKTEAARQRLLLGDSELERRKVLAKFEDLCDLWDGALGFGYDSSTEELHRFVQQWVPAFLDVVTSWAESVGDTALHAAADTARGDYVKAVASYRP